MKLGLVQTKHNAMYNFLNPDFPFDRGTCLAMQAAQVEQNLTLLAEAARQGYDLLVTTECINYIRTSNRNTPARRRAVPHRWKTRRPPLWPTRHGRQTHGW